MRFLVIGAGVIGQVYAGRLVSAGHDVTVVARGRTGDALERTGIRLTAGDRTTVSPVAVVSSPPGDQDYDGALVAVRFDQLDSVVDEVEGLRAERIVTLCNLPHGADRLRSRLGSDRTILAFAGVGGSRGADGGVRYSEVRQQPTTVGRSGGAEQPLVQALSDAGFAVDLADDMPAWLTTHATFIAGVGAAILLHDGDSEALGRDRPGTARMVAAVGEAFRALDRRGVRPAPAALRTIFTAVPRVIAVPYWQRQLRGTTGVDTIAPHIRATRLTEFPALAAAVRDTLGPSAPRLDALLREALP